MAARKNNPVEELRALRKYRGAKKVDLSIGAEVEAIRKKVVKRAGALGGLDEVWGEVVPREWGGLTRLVKLTPGGVLVVECADAAVCFEVDQWKRGGGLAVLRSQCAVTLKDVRVGVGKR